MRRALFTLPLLAGLAAAIVLTMPSVARAWDINALPDGYTIVGHIKNGDCTTYQIRGYDAAIDLSDCRPDFQQALDAWVEQTCPVDVCHPAPPVTTTAVPPVTTAPSSTTPPVTTVVTVPAVTTTVVTTTPTETQTVTTTTPESTQTVTLATSGDIDKINARLDLIDQRQATDEARIAQLEKGATPGMAPLGEPKNVSPFVA